MALIPKTTLMMTRRNCSNKMKMQNYMKLQVAYASGLATTAQVRPPGAAPSEALSHYIIKMKGA